MNSNEFLRAFLGDGFRVLTAIRVDKKGIETKTFLPGDDAKMDAWIKKRNGKANIYFSVNQPGRPMEKKCASADIVSVGWLHVDVDSRAGEDLGAELQRIRVLLMEKCPVPKPTVVVYSGGGYQAFIKLREPITKDPSQVVAYNKQLEITLGGDNCHNIDRIMRLPGTMNIPDKKKAARGRVPAMAEVVYFEPELVYTLADFTPAPTVQTPGVPTSVAAPTATVARLTSLDELDQWRVPDRVKAIILEGFDPDTPKAGDNSRSAWVFDAVCQLVRCDVPDDVIFSILTDPAFGISKHVMDQRGDTSRYAMRQIERAKEEVEEPWLRTLNDRFMVIGNMGGQCRVCEEARDPALDRRVVTHQTFADFRNRYCNRHVRVGQKVYPVGAWWLTHPKRRTYECITFAPGQDPPNAYNLWQGFAYEAAPGDKHERYLEHLFQNICNGNRQLFKYLISWMARTVQKPGELGEVAIILRGPRGVGKSFFVVHFGRLFGQHFVQVSDAKHLLGNFNAHLMDCVLLFGDEAFWAGDKSREGSLKSIITEKQILIERKGIDAQSALNVIHLILASNEDQVIPAGAQERRFLVLDVGEAHQKDTAYFQAIAEDLESGGYENLLHHLLNYDLTDFNVRKVPWTEALTDQVERKLTPAQDLVLEALKTGVLPVWHEKNADGRVRVAAGDFVPNDVKHRDTLVANSLAKSIGWALTGIIDSDEAGRVGAQRCRWLPSLQEARARWKKKFGYDIKGWPQAWIKPGHWGLPWAEKEQVGPAVLPLPGNGGDNGSAG